jgi:hypothetical protein
MCVFKMERERYASTRIGSCFVYVKAKNLYAYDLTSKQNHLLAPIQINGKQVMLNQPTSIYYNSFN